MKVQYIFIIHIAGNPSFHYYEATDPSSPDVNVSLLGKRMKEQLEGQGIPVVHDKTNMGDLLASKSGYGISHIKRLMNM